jgi:hypothetical protein
MTFGGPTLFLREILNFYFVFKNQLQSTRCHWTFNSHQKLYKNAKLSFANNDDFLFVYKRPLTLLYVYKTINIYSLFQAVTQ